ncbi:MAG: hypothetical protein NTV10_02570 [Methanoregula sp.]|nr:hypothetical protein [Methanoregula sp.]
MRAPDPRTLRQDESVFYGVVKTKCIEHRPMVFKFSDAVAENVMIDRIDHHELVRVHGDAHLMFSDEVPNSF